MGELTILEKAPTRPIRFTARTHGTLLVTPAALLPRVGQDLSADDAEPVLHAKRRFKTVAGVASRNLPSPRLGIVATSPRGCVLAGRLKRACWRRANDCELGPASLRV